MWKDKLHSGKQSNAELAVWIELKNLGMGGVQTQKDICLDNASIDFYFEMHGKPPVCIFLDGPPHLKDRQKVRDEHVTAKLEKRGYTVKRFPYSPPLSKTKLEEIIDTIKELCGYGPSRVHV